MSTFEVPRRVGLTAEVGLATGASGEPERGGDTLTAGAAGVTPLVLAAPSREPESPLQRHVRRKAWGATWGAIMRDAWKKAERGAS